MKTQRLNLRVLKPDDAEFMFRLMNTAKFHQYIGDRGVHSVDEARKYIEERMAAELDDKGFVNYLMKEQESGRAVGTCSLHNRRGVEGIDIGYALLPEFEGKGYAREGARAMIELAFEKHGLEKVSAITSDKNQRSYGLLEKLGFRRQGYIQLPGEAEQIRLYVLEKFCWK